LTARNEARLQETLSQMKGNNHSIIFADLSRQEDISLLEEKILCWTDWLIVPEF